MVVGTTPHTSETTPNPNAVEGVLDNDGDPEGDPFAVTAIAGCSDVTAPFDCTLASGAVVHVDANGEFSYIPAPGTAAGSFTYTVTDAPAAGVPISLTGTVTFTFFDMLWYVDPDARGRRQRHVAARRSTRWAPPPWRARAAPAIRTTPTTTSSSMARPRR